MFALRLSPIAAYTMLILILFCRADAIGQLKLKSAEISLKKGVHFSLNIPQGYQISVAAEGMRRVRFLAKSPDGRLFGTDMHSLADNKRGKIYVFDNWDNSLKKFNTITTFAEGLRNPNQVMFVTDNGKNYIYIAETDKLSRYEYAAGQRALSGNAHILSRFPDQGLNYKYGGWHLTRSLAQHGNKIYVSVGSSCNACIETEAVRASVLEMNADGSQQHIYATGIRNSVAIKWVDDSFWATFMSRDLLPNDKPDDLFGMIQKDKHHGWPWYVQSKQKIYPDVAMMDSARKKGIKLPEKPPVLYCGFKPHSAPLGFDRFTAFNDSLLRDNFVVALHGSTSTWRQRGNAVVVVTGPDRYTEIVTNFQTGKAKKQRMGRPCDVLMNDANSFFVTDDKNGALYYIWK